MTKQFLITTGLMGALSVIMGAVGAHILECNISVNHMGLFNTANQFVMFHALALLALTFMNRYVKRSYTTTIYYLFVIGIALFSGTLYISSLKELTGFGPSILSKLVPVGGLLLIAGWITIVMSGLNYNHKKRRS